MSNPILLIGHAALPAPICREIIEIHNRAEWTELESMNEKHGGHIVAKNQEEEDRLKYIDDVGVEKYSIGFRNPDFRKIMDWVQDFIPWSEEDFNAVTYMQTMRYPMESYMGYHKDNADEGDTGTVIFTLNEEFTGGNFHVDGHTIIPFTGSMVAFNNSTKRWHGVDPILTGERYCLAIWFGKPVENEESMTEYDTSEPKLTHPKFEIKE